MTRREPPAIRFRKPEVKDGSEVWNLVRDSGGLDLNSAYSYLMLCDLFRDTCSVAESEGRIVGFTSAFRKPEDGETLFVWQIAVDRSMRGRGVGRALIREVLERASNSEVTFLEATIGPNNIPSRRLFLGIAESLGADCSISQKYASDQFPGPEQHDDELLYRIGPLAIDRSAADRPQRMEEINK